MFHRRVLTVGDQRFLVQKDNGSRDPNLDDLESRYIELRPSKPSPRHRPVSKFGVSGSAWSQYPGIDAAIDVPKAILIYCTEYGQTGE